MLVYVRVCLHSEWTVVCLIKEYENWIRMHKQYLLLDSSHKGKSFKIAHFEWMQVVGVPILFQMTHTHTHTEATAPAPIWNASFIHSTSELNFPFALNVQTLNRICAIDTSTQKRQFTHEIVCFWCINNFRHARLSARLTRFRWIECRFCRWLRCHFTYVSAAKCILRFAYIVDSKHYDASMLCIDFEWKLTSSAVICFRSLHCVVLIAFWIRCERTITLIDTQIAMR